MADLARAGVNIAAVDVPQTLGAACAAAAADGKDFNFASWRVVYADERLVPLDDDDSNHKSCSTHVFGQEWAAAIPAENVFTVNPELVDDAAAAAEDYAAKLREACGVPAEAGGAGGDAKPPVIDLVLLGMGPDGHTCSLFPGHALLEETDATVAAIEDSPKPPPRRITLTLPVVNAARDVAFVCTGASKTDALKQVLAAERDAADALPSARVWPSDGRLTWFVDAPALGDTGTDVLEKFVTSHAKL